MSQQVSPPEIKLRKTRKQPPYIDYGFFILASGFENSNKNCEKCNVSLTLSKWNGINVVLARKRLNKKPNKIWCIKCMNKLGFRITPPTEKDFRILKKLVEAS